MRRPALLAILALAAALLPAAPPAATAQAQPAAADPVTPEVVEATVAPDDLVLEQVVEAEDLLPPVAATLPVNERPSCCGLIRSGDAAIRMGTNSVGGPGDSATLALDIPADGTWELGVDYSVDPTFGIAELRVDGTVLGAPFNSYAPALANDRRVTYPPVELTAGRHELTFTILGKDDRSRGYSLGMDLFRLRRLPDDGRLALTPPDGAFVSGLVPVLGVSTDPADEPALAIDGAPVEGRAAIGGDFVTLLFEADGMQSQSIGFANRVRVRGQEYALASDVDDFADDSLDLPGELFAPGVNTVTIVAGADPADADGNRDDFDLRQVQLELPDGTVLTDPAMAGQYAMGDGCCPDPASAKPTELSFRFTVPPPTDPAVDYDPARGAVWDTTAVADGPHTVAARVDGAERVSAVQVDNTPPAFTTTTPVDGERLKGTFTVDAEATDAVSGVETATATFDGEPIALGAVLSTDDLADGTHTVVFTAVDRAGNTTEYTATVTTVREQPDAPVIVAPEDGATGVPRDPSLQVHATDPAGDPLEVTFLEAGVTGPRPGRTFAGDATTAPPAGLVPAGEADVTGRDVRLVEDADGAVLPAGPSTGFPYQRYDLAIEQSQAAAAEVTWTGTTDSAREVVLSAWDLVAGTWAEIARGRGAADGAVELRGTVDLARMRDGDVVHVLVQGSDPFADDIADPPDEAFKDPGSYDFSLAWMTDTQYLSEGAVEGRPGFAEAYRDINEWIVANADERKIAYAAHTGDLINNWISINNTSPAYVDLARREFAFASDTMAVLEDAGMPYGVTPGNHDNKFGTTNELYNEYFPPSRFAAASATAEQPYYGGSWREGDNQNHYDLFSAGGQDFVVVYLGFIAGQEEIDWANEVLAAHADRKAIFATHEYLRPSRNPDGRDGALSDENARSQGAELFTEVVLPNDNVFLTLSGHTHGVALNIRRDVDGVQGRTVVEMLANYQFYQVDGERRVGHFRLLQFDVDRSEVAVNTYSPTLDDHNADEYDTANNRDYTPAADEFTVPVDLATRTTSFATDAVALEVRTEAAIGADRVASGEVAATTWTGLRPLREYAWYAVAADDFGGTAASTVATFTTDRPRNPRRP